MSKPKTLEVFDRISRTKAYSRLNNYTEVTKDGNCIVLGVGDLNGDSMITFRAPCNCSEISKISIANELYDICDTNFNTIEGNNVFASGALVTMLLDVDNKKAYIQGSSVGNLDEKADKLNPVFPENVEVQGEMKIGEFTIVDEGDRLVIY